MIVQTRCKKCLEVFVLKTDKEMEWYSINIWKRFESLEHSDNCKGLMRERVLEAINEA